MRTTLYEIAPEIRAMQDQSEDGLMTPEMEAQFDALGLSFEEGAEYECKFIRESESREAGLVSERDRIDAQIQTERNIQRARKERLLNSFLMANVRKLKTTLFTLWLQRGPGSIEVSCLPEELPTEFQRVTITADKWKLGDYLKEYPDAIIAGVERREGRESIRIK